MSAHTEQRKLAAIMFTDKVGYRALSQRNEAFWSVPAGRRFGFRRRIPRRPVLGIRK